MNKRPIASIIFIAFFTVSSILSSPNFFGALFSEAHAASPSFESTNGTSSFCKINSFTAKPGSIVSGTSTTLSWSTSNCDKAVIYDGKTETDHPANGSTNVSPTTTTEYTLEAIFDVDGFRVSRVTVTVSPQTTKVLFMGGRTTDTRQYFNDIYSTADMEHWKLISADSATPKWAKGGWANAFYFQDKYWHIGGEESDTSMREVWNSINGSSWNKVGMLPDSGVDIGSQMFTFKGKIFFIEFPDFCSDMPGIWSSPDGKNWTQVLDELPFPVPRYEYAPVVFNQKIYLIGGYDFHCGPQGLSGDSDVWSSPDGKNWTKISDNNPWGPLAGAQAVVFKNSIYLLGGTHGNDIDTLASQKIWSSTDGKAWRLVSETLPKGYINEDMNYYPVVITNGTMWMLDPGNYFWHSMDAITWTKSLTPQSWPSRALFNLVSN